VPLLSLYYQGGADHLRGCRYVEQKWFPFGWGTRIEAFDMSSLSLSSASWASSVHVNWSAFFRS
jgi:hypothetical protein